jgi:antirestriction protein ArdC
MSKPVIKVLYHKGSTSMKSGDFYTKVTREIVASLEQGVMPWVKPWESAADIDMPANAVTKRPYNGMNVLLLWASAMVGNYQSGLWLTYKQALHIDPPNSHIRKGEHGTQIVLWRPYDAKVKNADGKDAIESRLMMRVYTVFNIQQCEGIPETLLKVTPRDKIELNYEYDDMIRRSGADIRIGGGKAAYIPSEDFIRMPPVEDFKSPDDYRDTLGHECVHWTGHEKRLNRDLSGRFGTESYAAEELIAAMGQAFLAARYGYVPTVSDNTARYIGSWIKVLNQDKRAVFTAASKAQQAVTFLTKEEEAVDNDLEEVKQAA